MKLKFPLWPRRKPEPVAAPVDDEPRNRGLFSTDYSPSKTREDEVLRKAQIDRLLNFPVAQPVTRGTMDSGADIGPPPNPKADYGQTIPDAQLYWFASQGNIGTFLASVIAQHWLVDKACAVPAKDAVRQGWKVDSDSPELTELLKEADEDMPLKRLLVEFLHQGRVQGGRVAFLDIRSSDPDFYFKPFNLDGVTPGSYRGVIQVDVENVQAEPTGEDLSDPASPNYFRPSYWRIGSRVFHHSHLIIFIPYPVANRLKPSYRWFGASVPQRIYERVYGAERTANEAPQLAMTKRLVSVQASENALDDRARLDEGLRFFAETRDNYGVYVHGAGESIAQHDTSLTDVDVVLMTQYQIVAAGADMPGTKLMQTSPKGFAPTGDYEESVYREHLETLQDEALPLMTRHYQAYLRSRGAGEASITVKWEALDSPTAAEWADINLKKAQTAGIYLDKMVVTQDQVYSSLRRDENSDFYGLEDERTQTQGPALWEDDDPQGAAAALSDPGNAGIPGRPGFDDQADAGGI